MRWMTKTCGAAAAAVAVTLALAAPARQEVKVQLMDGKGQPAGTVTLTPAKGGGVRMKIDLANIPVGEHGLHIHQNPTCEGPDFKTAGGHFNPTSRQHGFQNDMGHHAGDTPGNVSVGEDHTGHATWTLTDVTFDPGAPNSIFANGGTSIVVHEKADDMKTDPSGNSGNRIACGVIKQ
jgi:superoxide dismutase, Cu-Zn family